MTGGSEHYISDDVNRGILSRGVGEGAFFEGEFFFWGANVAGWGEFCLAWIFSAKSFFFWEAF